MGGEGDFGAKLRREEGLQLRRVLPSRCAMRMRESIVSALVLLGMLSVIAVGEEDVSMAASGTERLVTARAGVGVGVERRCRRKPGGGSATLITVRAGIFLCNQSR